MPHYQDLDNKVHFLESEASEKILPVGCRKITDTEAAGIIQEQVDAQPVKIPTELLRYQVRVGLENIGKLDDVIAVVGSMDKVAQIAWGHAPTIRRDHPLVVQIISTLELTETKVDELFVTWSKL